MPIKPPALNFDSLGLMRVMSSLSRRSSVDDTDIGVSFTRLTDIELEYQFRNSTLIQKIIKKYPMEAKSIGYQLINSTGVVIEESNEILLEAFKEASIFSRLYSRCFLYLDFDDPNDEKPVKKESMLTGFKIYFDLYLEGDFFINNKEKIHRDRIIEFIGVKSYSKTALNEDYNYADSVLQGLNKSMTDYVDNNENAKFIIKNLSYLTVGIDNLGNMSKSDEGRSMIFDRLITLNMNRSINKTIAYDKKSEIIGFVSQTISGINDVINQLKEIFVSETDYPVEELFEQAPSQKLGSGVQNQLIARYLWARRCRNWTINNWMQYYTTYFSRTKDMNGIKINIPFIVDLTEEERANVENIGADRIKKLIDAGVIDVEEARTGYLGNKYTLNIKLKDAPPTQSMSFTQEPDTPTSSQQDSIPDNMFWDALATITEQDLDQIGEELVK